MIVVGACESDAGGGCWARDYYCLDRGDVVEYLDLVSSMVGNWIS